MNFQQLRFVIAVADTNSFTRAADECCVTQPALSNAINQFEEELGGKLFNRTTRSVMPTEFGELMIAEMRNIIQAQSSLISNASLYNARDNKTIRVGVSPLISPEFVEGMLAKMSKKDPELNIILTEMNKADIPVALDGGGIDFGLGPVCLSSSTYENQAIYSEPLLYVSNEQNTKPVTLKDLEDKPLVLVLDDCGLAETVRTLFRNHQLRLKEYEGRALSYHILEKWALLGISSTILPASKVSDITHSRPVGDNSGGFVTIKFQATWSKQQEGRPNFAKMIDSFTSQDDSTKRGAVLH